jgi:telomere length regulation protein
LKLLSAEHLDRLGRCESEGKPTIAAVAGVLNAILGKDENERRHLVEWLTASSGAGLGEGIGIRRAVMAVISQNREDVVNVLEKSLGQFGDQLYIKHSPMLQQEGWYQYTPPKLTGTDQFDSPRPDPALGCRIRAQVNAGQVGHALTI